MHAKRDTCLSNVVVRVGDVSLRMRMSSIDVQYFFDLPRSVLS